MPHKGSLTGSAGRCAGLPQPDIALTAQGHHTSLGGLSAIRVVAGHCGACSDAPCVALMSFVPPRPSGAGPTASRASPKPSSSARSHGERSHGPRRYLRVVGARPSASQRKELEIDPRRRASLAHRGPPRPFKPRVPAVTLRLGAGCVFLVQALDQIRPALVWRLLHQGVEIGLKRTPETPRQLQGPPVHDRARSWAVLWPMNAK
jgi:hypothetical protein